MLVSLISLSLNACANKAALRLAAAETTKVEAGLVPEALKAQPLPALPPDCKRQEPSGIAVGDRLDTAVVKVDSARRRANARVLRCAGFYLDVKAGRDG